MLCTVYVGVKVVDCEGWALTGCVGPPRVNVPALICARNLKPPPSHTNTQRALCASSRPHQPAHQSEASYQAVTHAPRVKRNVALLCGHV